MTVPTAECFVDFVTLKDQPFAVPAVLSSARRGLTLTTVDTPPGCPCDAATLTQPREHFTTLLRSSIAAFSHAATMQLQRHAPSAVAADDYAQHMLALMKRPRGVDAIAAPGSSSSGSPFAAMGVTAGNAPGSGGADETTPLILQRFSATWAYGANAGDVELPDDGAAESGVSDSGSLLAPVQGRRLALCDYATRWRLARYLLLAQTLPASLVPNVFPLIAAYRVHVGNSGVDAAKHNFARREDTYLLQNLPAASLAKYLKDATSRPSAQHVRLIARELLEYLFVLHRGGVVAATLCPDTIFVDPTFSRGRASVTVTTTGCLATGEEIPGVVNQQHQTALFGFEAGAVLGSANVSGADALAMYRYSAPEVILARSIGDMHSDLPRSASPAADIWSLGAVLFEMLTRSPVVDLSASPTATLSFVPAGPVVPSAALATTALGAFDASNGASLYRDLEAESAAIAAEHQAHLSTLGLRRVNRAFVAGSGQVEHYLTPPGQLCPPPLSKSLLPSDPAFASGAAAWPSASPPVLSGASTYTARAAGLNECNAQTVGNFAAGTAQPVAPLLRYRAALEAAVGAVPDRMRGAFAAALPDVPSAAQTLRAAVASAAGTMAAASPSTTAFLRTQRRVAEEEGRGPTKGSPRVRRLLAESGADRTLCGAVEAMLSLDPLGRPTVEEALRTLAPYFGFASTAPGADGMSLIAKASAHPTPVGPSMSASGAGIGPREGSVTSVTSLRFRVAGGGGGALATSPPRANAAAGAEPDATAMYNALVHRGIAVPSHATAADVRLLYAGAMGSEALLARTAAAAVPFGAGARAHSAAPQTAASALGSATSGVDDLTESSWAIPWGTEPGVLQDVISALAPLMN